MIDDNDSGFFRFTEMISLDDNKSNDTDPLKKNPKPKLDNQPEPLQADQVIGNPIEELKSDVPIQPPAPPKESVNQKPENHVENQLAGENYEYTSTPVSEETGFSFALVDSETSMNEVRPPAPPKELEKKDEVAVTLPPPPKAENLEIPKEASEPAKEEVSVDPHRLWSVRLAGEELPVGTFNFSEIKNKVESEEFDVLKIWLRSEQSNHQGFVEIGPWMMIFEEPSFNDVISNQLKVRDRGASKFLKDDEWEDLIQGLSQEEIDEYKRLAA